MGSSYLTAINCIFSHNFTIYDHSPKVLYIDTNSSAYLYHCTFDSNCSIYSGIGHSIENYGDLYSYNSIYTGDTPQIYGDITDGNNLIEGIDGVTRELVFGTNEYDHSWTILCHLLLHSQPLD